MKIWDQICGYPTCKQTPLNSTKIIQDPCVLVRPPNARQRLSSCNDGIGLDSLGSIWRLPKMEVPSNLQGNIHLEIDDLGVPPNQETPVCCAGQWST